MKLPTLGRLRKITLTVPHLNLKTEKSYKKFDFIALYLCHD